MTSYDQLLEGAREVLKKYSMDKFLEGFTPELINALITPRMEKMREADSKEKCLQLLSESLSKAFGLGVTVDAWIKDKGDQDKLYEIYSDWRSKLLQ